MEANLTQALRWIVLLPLIGAVLNGLVIRSKNPWISGGLATFASLGAFVVAVAALSSAQGLGEGVSLRDPWFVWMEAGALKVNFSLEVTPITGVMLMIITSIGTLIHVFATGYMSHDAAPWRFFSYLNLFLSAMLTLVLSSNLVGVFLGWEGVGLCSYLLIGFWYGKDENAAAGMKAFVTNRIGDLGFLVALMVLFVTTGTFEIQEILQAVAQGTVPAWALLAVTAGIFWAATGKSAQIPLYVWLPDAMAGPTPVSALIHAATMVTSGIFVICRLWPLFAGQHLVTEIVLWTGIATAWLAALIALTQRDIKKVMAYSTVSQLGFMFAALGVGAPTAALFHVLTHACFKALLFLGAGSVIHGMHEKQDMFEMGGLRKHMPRTHLTFAVATAAIIGFPLSAGFFSKDMILAKAFEHGVPAYLALLGAALLTAFYMLRAYTLTFWGSPRSKEAEHAHESTPVLWVPLVMLAFLSVFIGWIETPVVFHGPELMSEWMKASWYGAQMPVHSEMQHVTEWLLMLVASILSLLVAWVSFRKYRSHGKTAPIYTGILRASEQRFYVDEIYGFILLKPLRWLAGVYTRLVDVGFINGTLHVFRDSVRVSGQVLALFHTGSLQTYVWYLAIGSALLVLLAKGFFG